MQDFHHDIELPKFLTSFIRPSFGFHGKIITSYYGRDFIFNNSNRAIRNFIIKSARINHKEFDEFFAFFNARAGALYSFLITDKTNFKVENIIFTNNEERNLSEIKLAKLFEDAFSNFTLEINYPKSETISAKKDERNIICRFNKISKKLELEEDIAPGEKISLSFEFFTPVRFITDKIEYKEMPDGSFELCEIVMKEVIDVV